MLGANSRLRLRRLPTAALLSAAAVLVPCTAWYVAGSRSAEREAQGIREEPLRAATAETEALTQRLGGRLEGLRADESWRPFYHYQSTYHDPTSSCQCASVTPSPLSQGLRDPLIETHFQVDPSLSLTMPSLHGDWPEIVTREWLSEQKQVHERLLPAAESCLASFDIDPTPSPGGDFHVEPDDPRIRVGEFRWRTIEVGKDPALVALRRVESSKGPLVQGFLVSREAVEEWLQPSSSPIHFVPSARASAPPSAKLQLPGVEWSLAADPSARASLATERADQLMLDFRRSFAVGSGGAAIAAMAVLLLLWQADRMARQRSRFAAAAAHELRTPLASLRLYGEMLQDDSLGDPGRREDYARRIADEAERLGRVVSNVLGFTRLERAPWRVRREAGDLGDQAREAVDRMRPAAAAQRIEIALRVEEGLPDARFDAEATQQMLQNLIDNALKYGARSDSRIDVEVALHGDRVRLAVRDRGPGVPPSMRERIFRPFERGGDPDAPAGLGLGLALVHSLAKAQDASLRLLPTDGEGACFCVDFPRA